MKNSSMSKKTSTSQQILSEIQSMKVVLESLKDQVEQLTNKINAIESAPKASKKKSSPKKKTVVKSGNVCINKYNDAVLVTGQTYDKRAILKKYKALEQRKERWSKTKNYDALKGDLEEHCSNVEERSVDEYFFDEPENSMGSNNSGDDHSVDSSFNPNAQYAFLDDED